MSLKSAAENRRTMAHGKVSSIFGKQMEQFSKAREKVVKTLALDEALDDAVFEDEKHRILQTHVYQKIAELSDGKLPIKKAYD